MDQMVQPTPRRVLGGAGVSVALLVALLGQAAQLAYVLYLVSGTIAAALLGLATWRLPRSQRACWGLMTAFLIFAFVTALPLDNGGTDFAGSQWSPGAVTLLVDAILLGAASLVLMRRISPLRSVSVILDTAILSVVLVAGTLSIVEQSSVTHSVSPTFGPLLVVVPALCIASAGLLVFALAGGTEIAGSALLGVTSMLTAGLAVMALWLDLAFDLGNTLSTVDLGLWIGALTLAALGATAPRGEAASARHTPNPGSTTRLSITAIAMAAILLPSLLVLGLLESWTEYTIILTVGLILVALLLVARALLQWRRMDSERALITGLLDNTDYGVMGVDEDGRVLFANESALRYFDFNESEFVGQPLHELTHHSYPDGRPYPCEQCSLREAVLSMRTIKVRGETFFTKSGAQLPVDVTITPMQTPGQSRMSVVSFRDLTESLALDRRQRQFVSVVSHELRTPVTSIRGSLQLLDAGVLGPMPEDQENLVRLAYRNAERLNLLINDILDLERLDSGRLTLHPESIDAVIAARGTVEEMAGAASAAGVHLEVDALETSVPVFVDPHRLAQILVNLIGNAIKFSDAGTFVTVRIRPEDSWARFDVVDHGRGIPEEALARIFERFGQVEVADTRTKGGTGLGLAIARELTVASTGSISVTSTYGSGTTFTVRLPKEGVWP